MKSLNKRSIFVPFSIFVWDSSVTLHLVNKTSEVQHIYSQKNSHFLFMFRDNLFRNCFLFYNRKYFTEFFSSLVNTTYKVDVLNEYRVLCSIGRVSEHSGVLGNGSKKFSKLIHFNLCLQVSLSCKSPLNDI